MRMKPECADARVWSKAVSLRVPISYYTPGRDGTRNAGRRPGSGGRPRGCGFEEQGGGARITRGSIPYSHFVCLCVCVCLSVVF